MDLEFEWVRQFFIQGQRHWDLHGWWHGPMGDLLDLWAKLEAATASALTMLQAAAQAQPQVPGRTKAEGREAEAGSKAERRAREKRRKHLEAVEPFSAIPHSRSLPFSIPYSTIRLRPPIELYGFSALGFTSCPGYLAWQVIAMGGEVVYQVLHDALTERRKKREGWSQREKESVWKKLDAAARPMRIPWPTPPTDLTTQLADLASWQYQFQKQNEE